MSYYINKQRTFYIPMASNYDSADYDAPSPLSPSGEQENRRRTSHVTSACDACHRDRKKCDNSLQCERCTLRGMQCTRTRDDGRRQRQRDEASQGSPSPPFPPASTQPSGGQNQYGHGGAMYGPPPGANANPYAPHAGYGPGAFGGAGLPLGGGPYPGLGGPHPFPPTAYANHTHPSAPYLGGGQGYPTPQVNFPQAYAAPGHGQPHAPGAPYPGLGPSPGWPHGPHPHGNWPGNPNNQF